MSRAPSLNKIAEKAYFQYQGGEMRFAFDPTDTYKHVRWRVSLYAPSHSIVRLLRLAFPDEPITEEKINKYGERPIAMGSGETIEESIANLKETPWNVS